MDMPPPCMVDHPGSNLDKPPDYRVYGWPDALSPERSVTDHMEQVIRQTSDEEPCLICCKPMTTCLVPSQGILSFFDPVFNLGTTIVNPNYLVRLKIRVCHNESDTRKEFTHVPFDFTDDPSGIIPYLRLVLELDHPDLYAALWRATGGPLQEAGCASSDCCCWEAG